jgi:HTH-type transcriptional regulator/antitoxin HigA
MDSETQLSLWQDPSGDNGPPKPPGFYIEEELKTRGWNQADLATVTGRQLSTINDVINSKRGISPEFAVALARAFGTTPDLWAHREAAYRLSLVNQSDPDTAHRARLFQVAPVKEMQKRGWIQETDSVAEIEKELCGFLGVSSLDDELGFHAVARKTFKSEEFSSAQRVWLMQAARMAASLKVRTFTPQKLTEGMVELHKLAIHPDRARYVPVVLAEIGIRFVVVAPLPKSRIDGAAFFLDDIPSQPVIVLSLRNDRMDCFWHTLIHETRHIAHADALSLDTNIVGELKPSAPNEMEARADREAAQFLIPKDELDSFIIRARPNYPKERVAQFAARLKIHPSIVVGQLQHRQVIGWKNHRDLLSKVNEHVLTTAMSDGWKRA